MSDTLNLALDFEPASKPSESTTARIFVETAMSFLKHNGAVVISKNCINEEALRAEVERLTQELARIEEEGARLFAGLPREVAADTAQAQEALESSAHDQQRTPLQIDRNLRVADCMTQPVTTVRRNQMLDEANARLRAGRFRHLVVLDDEGGEVVGILSKRQIALSALDWVMGHGTAAYEKMIESTSVKEVMETQLITIAPDAPLSDAGALLSEHKIGCLLVMQKDRLVGILTEGDFVSLLSGATVPDA
ncbi:MAG: CBS domain-containing protein [Deltaproteobacteria bacterium]|nr:CBS domain-containing protein [Deltaproteobacteria bacterium]MBW2388079.1 CBS domain-containing protein [Deltaproteobacteria bacterium]MBW2725588.1 CBS domain-containing protein [Deltaproteobacteria bacterium]